MTALDPARVSVVLCTFNGEGTVGPQLDSLLKQTERRIDILAMDDASTDRTAEILHAYAARDARVRVRVNPQRLGAQANFAAAFEQCRGSFIAPCDQDDVWRPRKLEALVAAIGDADLAYCDSEFADAAGRGTGRRLSHSRGMVRGRDPLPLVPSNSVSGHALLFRRELLARAQPFPDVVLYDWWLAIAAATGSGIVYVDEPLVLFRRHGAAATGLGRDTARPAPRRWLEERHRLLGEMKRFDGPRRADIERLERALGDGLDRGQWLPALRLAWRYREPLGRVLGTPPTLLQRLLRRAPG